MVMYEWIQRNFSSDFLKQFDRYVDILQVSESWKSLNGAKYFY